MSTITTPDIWPDTNQDCIALHKAFEDIGCDKKTVIEILCHRNQEQRRAIREMYRDKYEEDLLERLKSELHAKLERAVLLWMRDPADRDASIIRDALKGWNKNDRALTEVICSRTSSQLQAIRQAYNSMFSRSLEEDIAITTSGDEKKLLLAFIRQHRPEDLEVEMPLAQVDAKDLFKAIGNGSAIEKAAIISILSTRSPAQLNAAFDVYKLSYGYGIEKVLKQEKPGGFQQTLRAVIKCIQYPVKYFTKVLYKSMKGLGTDDSTLIRVVVTRSEIDMEDIKEEFVRKYKKSLQQMISSDTSGYYKTFLLTLIGARLNEHHSGSLVHRMSSSTR